MKDIAVFVMLPATSPNQPNQVARITDRRVVAAAVRAAAADAHSRANDLARQTAGVRNFAERLRSLTA